MSGTSIHPDAPNEGDPHDHDHHLRPAARHGRADGVRRPLRRRPRRHHRRRQRARRRAARPLPGARRDPVRRPHAGPLDRHRPALRRRVAARPGRRRLRRVRRRHRHLLDDAGAGLRADRPDRTGVPARRLRARARRAQGRAAGGAGVPHRRRHRLARAGPRGLHRLRAVLPARLPDAPARRVDPGARRGAGQARGGRDRRRPGLWPRRQHPADGRGVPAQPVHGLRLPRGLHRRGPRARDRGRPRGPGRPSRCPAPSRSRRTTSTW